MGRRTIAFAVLGCVLFSMPRAAHAQVANRNPRVDIKQSDKILFGQAQKAMSKSNYAEARKLLEKLINTDPDSDYVPRAKLSIADAWYSQHALKQAELEYRDFVTFFPNRPEVAKAQRRIDAIHRQGNF